jgi:hypothetical protein
MGGNTKRFMMLVKTTGEFSGPPPQALIDAINKQGEAAVKSGAMIANGGLAPVTAGTTVRIARNKLTTTDGPFTEAKEVVGGFAIFDMKSKQEAVESAQQFMELHLQHWPGWEGATEVRQILSAEDFLQPYRCQASPD